MVPWRSKQYILLHFLHLCLLCTLIMKIITDVFTYYLDVLSNTKSEHFAEALIGGSLLTEAPAVCSKLVTLTETLGVHED